MGNVSRDQLLRKPFNDFKNYPYGFTRSGDFSIKEANILGQYGSLYSALTDGSLIPENDQDKLFLEVINEVTECIEDSHRVWIKYLKKINRVKIASIYGGRKSNAEEDDLGSGEDEVDLITDDD